MRGRNKNFIDYIIWKIRTENPDGIPRCN